MSTSDSDSPHAIEIVECYLYGPGFIPDGAVGVMVWERRVL